MYDGATVIDKLVAQIGAYFRDRVGDRDFLREVVREHGPTAICETVAGMIASPDDLASQAADLFFVDLLSHLGTETQELFHSPLLASSLPEALRRQLFGEDHFRRARAIGTITRVGVNSTGALLREAIARYATDDPLLLRVLLREADSALVPGEQPDAWEIVDALGRGPGLLTRWAVLPWLGQQAKPFVDPDDGAWQRGRALADHLAADEHPLLGAEARWVLECFRRYPEMASGDRSARRAISRALNAMAPVLTFENVANRFANELHRRGRSSYQLDDLERFVQELAPLAEGDRLLLHDVLCQFLSSELRPHLRESLRTGQRIERFKREYRRLRQSGQGPVRKRLQEYAGLAFASDDESASFLDEVWLVLVGSTWVG